VTGTVIASVLWHNPSDRSSDLCRLLATAEGFALEGTALVPVDGEPALAAYRVDADGDWRTRSAELRLDGAGWERQIELAREGDGWLVDGRRDDALEGCVDVDLRLTAATNTLPIRRLDLAVGRREDVRAAWVGFPELQVQPLEQGYERLAEDRYRYRSDGFTAELLVDAAGLVVRYGDDLWAALAHADDAR
jgi:uncharacterized protein